MLVHPQFDPVALSLGPIAIRWYGLMYLVAFGLFFFLGRYRAKRDPWRGVSYALIDDLLFFGVLGVVLGGRLGYVLFYKPGYYAAHPLEIFAVWQGGMAFHGGPVPRHPSQLYQFALEGLLLFAILWLYSARQRPAGAVSGAFLLGYGVFRFAAEYFREPDNFLGLLAFDLSMGQWLSLPMIAVGAGVLAWAYGRR